MLNRMLFFKSIIVIPLTYSLHNRLRHFNSCIWKEWGKHSILLLKRRTEQNSDRISSLVLLLPPTPKDHYTWILPDEIYFLP